MQHIGFIMDGNRRWAKKLGNIALFGHERGGENVERVLEMCLKRDIPYVSMWALSKENIVERSTVEVEGIFTLFRKKIPTLIPKLIHHSIRLEYIGDRSLLPDDIALMLDDAVNKTKQGTSMTFILAIAYSGQDEIIRGLKRYITEGKDLNTLDERSFLESLDS
jgi:undecaprenyl diphosphate synthase